MDSCTLPNLSTDMTAPSASPLCTRLVGAGSVTRSPTSSGEPTDARSVPAARWAATGMKMSRPWKVCDSGCSHSSPLRSEEHTSELQSHHDLVCRLLLEKKKEK